CALAQRYQEAPLFDYETTGDIERRPGSTEHEPPADGGEHEAHAGQREPPPRRHGAGVRDRYAARHPEDHEDAGREEGDAERRHAASALADLQTIGRFVMKQTSHVLSIGSSPQAPDRATESNAS